LTKYGCNGHFQDRFVAAQGTSAVLQPDGLDIMSIGAWWRRLISDVHGSVDDALAERG
jgi:hypothetical protein